MKPYHKRFAGAAALAFLLLTGAQARTWTSADGAKTFEGELRSYDAAAGKVTVTLPNGKPLVFMQDKLSADDIAFVKENASKLPPAGGAAKSSIGSITADPKDLFKKHDDKPADMSKPVQVFILLGQSNMVGLGNIRTLEEAVKSKSKYPYLVDEGGGWTQRKDVRNVFVMCSGNSPAADQHNDWMSVSNRRKLGPEYGIGHALGNAIDAPVMILKSCIGNRSLGFDLLPPGSESYKFNGETQLGYRGTGADPEGKGERAPGEWYAGCQYDGDVAAAKKVLENLGTYYPEGKSYEIAGFFFWQGEKDCGSEAHAERYEKNLIQFIKALRKDFNAPNAKFVLATLGEATKDEGGNKGKITEAQLAVDGKKNKEFKGNVATVFSNPFWHGGSGNSHYDGNAETYMDVGEEMGRSMVELLKSR
jgi:hypothetical protein